MILKSCFVILNGNFLLNNNIKANTTLIAWAKKVAMAAPAASKCNPATRTKSPIILITQATATNKRGDLLSPKPLKIADNRL